MSASSYTIDDSQWGTSALSLTSGWNMLRQGGALEYINATQAAIMQPLLSNWWNQSISWTTTGGSAVTLNFSGTDFYAYGPTGPSYGHFSVKLDSATIGTYNAHAEVDTHSALLFQAHSLDAGSAHSLTMTLVDNDGSAFGFDVANITTAAAQTIASVNPVAAASAAAAQSAAVSASLAAAAAASASAAAEQALMGDLTPSQLALLTTPYVFKWNGAAYFVVIFASCISAAFAMWLLVLLIRHAAQKRRARRLKDQDVSWLSGGDRRERPTTRVLDALRGKQISAPISDDGHSESTKRAGSGMGSYEDRDTPKDW